MPREESIVRRLQEFEPRRGLRIQIASLITGSFLQQGRSGDTDSALGTPHDLPTRVIALDTGPEVHYFRFGQGHPVVFVHGSFADYRAWFGQMDAFSSEFEIVAYSRRHHHPNAWNTDPEASCTRAHAEDLAALIRGLGLARPTLIGQSSGGLVALHTAALFPDLVHGLILSEPFVPSLLDTVPGGVEAWNDYEAHFWRPAARAFEEGVAQRGIAILCDAIFGDGAFDGLPADIRPLVLSNADEMRLEFSNSLFFSDLPPDSIAGVTHPTLLVEGDSSPMLYRLIMQALATAMPHARRLSFPDVSHVAPFLARDEFNRQAIAFIRSTLGA